MESPPPRRFDSQAIAARVEEARSTHAFADLTPERQDEFSERWEHEIELQRHREEAARAGLVRCLAEGAGIFFCDAVLLDVPSLGGVAAALVLGALTGLGWWRMQAGRIASILIAVPGYLLLRLGAGSVNVLALFWSAPIFLIVCGIAGVLRDLRSADGWQRRR